MDETVVSPSMDEIAAVPPFEAAWDELLKNTPPRFYTYEELLDDRGLLPGHHKCKDGTVRLKRKGDE